MGVPPVIIQLSSIYRWIFHEIDHPAIGVPSLMETPICPGKAILSPIPHKPLRNSFSEGPSGTPMPGNVLSPPHHRRFKHHKATQTDRNW